MMIRVYNDLFLVADDGFKDLGLPIGKRELPILNNVRYIIFFPRGKASSGGFMHTQHNKENLN
jgi:hypothetical protein